MGQADSYYKMPFNASTLMKENGSIEMCSQAENIAQHLMLLITTKPGENRYDLHYGNAVWNIEFEKDTTEGKWEACFRESILEAINRYEPRIYHPVIYVKTVYVEQNYKMKNFTEVKKKATIHIHARLTDTSEHFNFSTTIYLSPMSVD